MKLKAMGLASLAGLAIFAAQAHHSPPPLNSTPTEITGILRSAEFMNPHSQFKLEAKDASGKTINWVFEGQPPAWFSKAGIKRSDFAKGIGLQVTITARVARDNSPFGIMSKMTFPDGTYVAT